MNWTCWRTSRHLFAYCPSRRELVLPMWPPPGIWILCGAHANSFIVLRSRTCYTCLFSFCFLKLVYFLFGSSQSNQFGLFSHDGRLWTLDFFQNALRICPGQGRRLGSGWAWGTCIFRLKGVMTVDRWDLKEQKATLKDKPPFVGCGAPCYRLLSRVSVYVFTWPFSSFKKFNGYEEIGSIDSVSIPVEPRHVQYDAWKSSELKANLFNERSTAAWLLSHKPILSSNRCSKAGIAKSLAS